MEAENNVEAPKKMNWLLPTVAVVVLLFGGYYFMNKKDNNTQPTQSATQTTTPTTVVDEVEVGKKVAGTTTKSWRIRNY